MVDGLKRKQSMMTVKSRFKGMTKRQIENWAKTTIGIHVRQWKIRVQERKELNATLQQSNQKSHTN